MLQVSWWFCSVALENLPLQLINMNFLNCTSFLAENLKKIWIFPLCTRKKSFFFLPEKFTDLS